MNTILTKFVRFCTSKENVTKTLMTQYTNYNEKVFIDRARLKVKGFLNEKIKIK